MKGYIGFNLTLMKGDIEKLVKDYIAIVKMQFYKGL